MDEKPFNPEAIAAAVNRAGEQWADAQAAADLLEETRKSVLAKLSLEAAGGSVAAREMIALASQEYQDFLAGMVKARQAANKAKVRYSSAQVFAELRRSEESTKRAEMRL